MKGTNINCPKEPAAITTPRAKVLFSVLTDLPTAPKTTAVPQPAPPRPNKKCDPIVSKDVSILAIQANPKITRVMPSNEALYGEPLASLESGTAFLGEGFNTLLEVGGQGNTADKSGF